MSIVTTIGPEPPRILMLPFAMLLIAIAFAPLFLKHHWDRHYYKICFALAAIVFSYYWLLRGDAHRVVHAVLEYLSFVIVIGSFFTVAGGIHLRPSPNSRPVTNAVFLLLGALLASVIGTIGASMVLIRPWIEMNKTRFAGFHLAFFIFVVSNVGGLLLPIGPPLLLGYQKGVPFFWPLVQLWPHWLFITAFLILIFYVIDFRNASIDRPTKSGSQKWRVFGKRNVVFVFVLLIALVAMSSPARELVMLVAAAASFFVSPRHVHEANGFTFLPLKEVSALFFGIFGTAIPVLDYMQLHGKPLGIKTAAQFFWLTGMLSSLLDNAPTYLTFLAAALGLHDLDITKQSHIEKFAVDGAHSLIAISLGASLFGALTYIGNGPNLLVKAVVQNANVPTPTFFGFIVRYAAPVLLPLFALLSLVFFSN